MSEPLPSFPKAALRGYFKGASEDFAQGRFDLALIGFGKVLAQLPENPNILFNLALARAKLEDFQAAARDLSAVADLEAPDIGADVVELAEFLVQRAKESEGEYLAHEIALLFLEKLGEQGLGNTGLLAETVLLLRRVSRRVRIADPHLRDLDHVTPKRPEPVPTWYGPSITSHPATGKPVTSGSGTSGSGETGKAKPSSPIPMGGSKAGPAAAEPPAPPSPFEKARGPSPPSFAESEEVFSTDGELKSVQLSRPGLRFADVIGMASEKRFLRAHVMLPLRRPELFTKYGLRRTSSLLLFGPPGVGKSYLIRALAGEAGIGLISVRLDAIINKWVGSSEKNLHAVFLEARKHAPCILLVDELDGLGISRDNTAATGSPSYSLLVNQFLLEMDELARSDSPVFVVGTTNRPWEIDPALRRSGRFTDLLYVSPPGPEERSVLFGHYTEGAPRVAIDWKGLADETDGFSGADIAAICRDAKIRAIEMADEKSLEEVPISPKILKTVMVEHANGGRSVREWYHRVLGVLAQEGLRDAIPDRDLSRLMIDAQRFQRPSPPKTTASVYHA